MAAADGTVVIATYSYSAGNYIMIDHGGGVRPFTCTAPSFLQAREQKVKKRIIFATGNENKMKEIRMILADLDWKFFR